MIYQDIQITVNQGLAQPDKSLYIFRGDSNIILNFKLVTPQYMLTKDNKDNLVTRFGVDNFELRLQLEKGYDRIIRGVITEDGCCRTQLTQNVIQELRVGTYSYQITLIDDDANAIMTFPICKAKLNILDRMSLIADELAVPKGLSGETMADLSVIVKDEYKIAAFDSNGNYIKTSWGAGDIISSAKLNKIEEAIHTINQNEKVLNSTKANKTELDVERKRIDNLAKLPAGSTSGDAELIDARIDVCGNTYTNVGDAIRENFRPIFLDNEVTKVGAITTKMVQSGDIVYIPYNMPAQGLMTVTIIDTDNIINMDGEIIVGVTKTDGTSIDNLGFPGTSGGVCAIELNYPIKAVRVWFAPSSVKGTGNVTITVSSTGLAEKVNNHEMKIKQLYDRDISVSQSFSITASQAPKMYTIPINIPANTPITITLESPDDAIDPMTNNYAIAGITNEWGSMVNNLGIFSYDNSVTFQINQNVKAVRIWFKQTSIKKDGELIISIQARSIAFAAEDVMRQVDNLRNNTNDRVTFIENYLHLEANVNYGTYEFDQTTEGSYGASSILSYDYKAGTPIYVTYRTDGNNSSTPLMFGCNYVNLGYVAGQVEVDLGETVAFTPKDDFTSFVIWAQNVTPGSYTVSIDSTDVYSQMSDLQGAMNASKELGEFVGYSKDVTYARYQVSNGVEQQINSQGVLTYPYKKGEPFYITFSCDNSSAHSTTLYFGCNYRNWGYVADQFRVELNTTTEFIPPDEIINFNIWAEMASADTFILETHSTNQITLVDRIEALENQNGGEVTPSGVGGYKSFSIVGDSYSTFQDWLPSGNAVWYPPTGSNASNDVRKVQETWWWQLADRTGMTLFMNDSWSGSTICGTGYSGANVLNTSAMVTRVKTHMGQTKVLGPKPDVIFIFGGTNDSWAGSPIGSLKYSDWTDGDLMQVLPAFCSMVNYLQTWNPGCRIINITNTDLKADITNGLATACAYYGIENIQLKNVAKIQGHPSIAGMKAIADQIIAIL